MAALAIERQTRDALLSPRGKVVKVLGLVIEATGPAGAVGDLCQLRVSRATVTCSPRSSASGTIACS